MTGRSKNKNMIRVNGEDMEWRPGLTAKDILETKSYAEPIIVLMPHLNI